jgi:hypothetical protein
MRAIPTLRDADELTDFLLKSSDYPLFCKPNSSMQSLGSVALTGVDRATNLLRTPNGRDIPLADFARSVAHYADKGYLIQKQLRPHPDLRNSIGEAVPTVRVVTLNGARGPRVFRAVWKIPGKGNYADNFWRPGNMLAALDYQTGRVVRLITGTGIKQQVLEALPQSASPASDLAVPDWNRLIELALTAADALPRLRLIGWDLAPTEDGPCIIEANDTPDFALPQYAERRGVLDSDFAAFARECEQQRRIDLTEIRKALSGGQQKDFRRLRRQAALSGQ